MRLYQWKRCFSSCYMVRKLDASNGHTLWTNTSNSPIALSSGMLSSFCSSLVNWVSIPFRYLEQKVSDSFIIYASTIDPSWCALFQTNCFNECRLLSKRGHLLNTKFWDQSQIVTWFIKLMVKSADNWIWN